MVNFDTAYKKQVDTNPQDEKETMQQPPIVEYVSPKALNVFSKCRSTILYNCLVMCYYKFQFFSVKLNCEKG